MNAFAMPDGTVTTDACVAAEQWASAFYMAKDALSLIRPIPVRILNGDSVRNLDEILAECDGVLSIGEK